MTFSCVKLPHPSLPTLSPPPTRCSPPPPALPPSVFVTSVLLVALKGQSAHSNIMTCYVEAICSLPDTDQPNRGKKNKQKNIEGGLFKSVIVSSASGSAATEAETRPSLCHQGRPFTGPEGLLINAISFQPRVAGG